MLQLRQDPCRRMAAAVASILVCGSLMVACTNCALAQPSSGKPLVFRPTGTGSPLTQNTIEKFHELMTEQNVENKGKVLQELTEIEKRRGFVTADDLSTLWHRYPPKLRDSPFGPLVVTIGAGILDIEIQAQALRLLTNGKAKNEHAKDWVATQKLDADRFSCTGTLIGPRVLLTAAHCVPSGNTFTLRLGEKAIDLDCERHPAYADAGFRSLFDYGLCRARAEFPRTVEMETSTSLCKLGSPGCPNRVPVDLKFERLSLDAQHAAPSIVDINSRWLLLAGYGCSDRQGAKPDGKLRAGFARISFYGDLRLISGSPLRQDSAIVCQGDSGGAAFRLVAPQKLKVPPVANDPDARDPYGSRVIVGVNSANILQRNLSFLAKTSAPAFVSFLNSWRRRMGNPKVCGIDPDLGDDVCRSL